METKDTADTLSWETTLAETDDAVPTEAIKAHMTLVVKQQGCISTSEFQFDELKLNQIRIPGGMRVELVGKVLDPFTPFKAVSDG